MEDRKVLIGSIVFVFGSFILMVGLLVYESYKAKQMKALALSITTETRLVPSSVASQDYSMYKTKMGDEGREMVQVPEGPFIMGSKDGDPDEVPERQVFLKGFFLDKKEVSQEEYARFAKMTKRPLPKIEVFEDDQSKLLKPEFAAMSMSWDERGPIVNGRESVFPRKQNGKKPAVARGSESTRGARYSRMAAPMPMWMGVKTGIGISHLLGRSSPGEAPTEFMT